MRRTLGFFNIGLILDLRQGFLFVVDDRLGLRLAREEKSRLDGRPGHPARGLAIRLGGIQFSINGAIRVKVTGLRELSKDFLATAAGKLLALKWTGDQT